MDYKALSGWSALPALLLTKEPENESDLVLKIRGVEANFEPDHLYESEDEAWNKAEAFMTELRDEAQKDLDFLSKPYTSPQGRTYSCAEDKLEKWREEVQKKLSIAERGLEICRARKAAK